MRERETLLEIHDALLLALDATEDVPGCPQNIADAHGYVRQALMSVVDLLIEKSRSIATGAASC